MQIWNFVATTTLISCWPALQVKRGRRPICALLLILYISSMCNTMLWKCIILPISFGEMKKKASPFHSSFLSFFSIFDVLHKRLFWFLVSHLQSMGEKSIFAGKQSITAFMARRVRRQFPRSTHVALVGYVVVRVQQKIDRLDVCMCVLCTGCFSKYARRKQGSNFLIDFKIGPQFGLFKGEKNCCFNFKSLWFIKAIFGHINCIF